MTTSTTTNRLDEIATRQRQGRIRDAAFAVMIAVFLVLSLLALREAGATPIGRATKPAKPAASSVHHVAIDVDTGATLCSPTVC